MRERGLTMDIKCYEKIKEFYNEIFGIISIINDIISGLWNFKKDISIDKKDVKLVVMKMYELTNLNDSAAEKIFEFAKEAEELSTSCKNFIEARHKILYATWNIIAYVAKHFDLTDEKITEQEIYQELSNKEPEELFETAISEYTIALDLCNLITDSISNFFLNKRQNDSTEA